MLLHELNREEKKSFWVIASFLTMVDGVLQDEEKELMAQYNSEMSTSYEEIHPSRNDFRKGLDYFKNSPLRIRKIVYYKLFGLAFSDSEYTIDEQRMLDLTRREFSISESDGSALEGIAKDNGEQDAKLDEILNVE